MLSAFFAPLNINLGWFALFSGIGGVYVFHFEFGRLMCFLKVHCPERYVEFPHSTAFEVFAFIHPTLLRTFWQPKQSLSSTYSNAIQVYRSAWFFSFFTLAFLFVLIRVLQ